MIALVGALLSGVLYGLSFPPFNFSLLAWIAFVPLLVIEKPKPLHAFLAGFVANLIIFFWLIKTFHAAHIEFITTYLCWFALSGILAVYFAVFIALYRRLPRYLTRPWLAGIIWGGLEVVRSSILTGFPWALLAHSQANNLPILQIVSLGGEIFLSIIIVIVNVGVAELIFRRDHRSALNIGYIVVSLGFVCFWGWLKLNAATITQIAPLKVAILQGNIDQYQKWDAAYEAGIRKQYEALVIEATQSHPDLIIWPESSVPGWFPNDAFYLEWVKQVVVKSSTTHLIGAVTTNNHNEYNAAFLIDAKGNVAGEYRKRHRVPFGEYIPFGNFLKRWIPYLGQLGTFEAGTEPVLFSVKGFKVAPNICYEAMFSGLVESAVRQNAEVVVNITNDGWFLDTGAPEQHFVTNIFRAVESGRPVVRAANTGISAVIDANGRVLLRSPMLTPGVYVFDVPVTPHATIFSMLYSRLCPAN